MAPVVVGGLYFVRDDAFRLPPEPERQVHSERRPFLVLSGSDTNSDDEWRIASGCPLSSSTRYHTHLDVKMAAGEAGLPKKCWVRVHALQPVMKSDLEDHLGVLGAERLQEVQARVLQYLGLIGR
jgi:mRNA-degrading endonuclease toxin of MazEF toxin-antitoxin module